VGSDAGAVKNAVDTINGQLATAKMEVPKLAEQVPMLKPVAEFVKGITCEADGVRATVTGRFEGEPASLLALVAGLMPRQARAEVAPAAPPGGAAKQHQPAGPIDQDKK
jgi:hypothetical protein